MAFEFLSEKVALGAVSSLEDGRAREDNADTFLNASSNGRPLRLSDLGDEKGDEDSRLTQKIPLNSASGCSAPQNVPGSADPLKNASASHGPAASPARGLPLDRGSLDCSYETGKSAFSHSDQLLSSSGMGLPSHSRETRERREREAGVLPSLNQESERKAGSVPRGTLFLHLREMGESAPSLQDGNLPLKRTAQASLARVQALRETVRRARAELIVHAEETPGGLSRLWETSKETFSELRIQRRQEAKQGAERETSREKRLGETSFSLPEVPRRRQRLREREEGTDNRCVGREAETGRLEKQRGERGGGYERIGLRPERHADEEETFSLRNLAAARRR